MALLLVSPSGTVTPVDPSSPILSADDLAALRSDGVFEVALVRNGEVRALEYHLERFEKSADVMGIPGASADIWRKAVLDAASTWTDPSDALVRWVLSRGRESDQVAHGWISVEPAGTVFEEERANGLSVLTLSCGFAADMAGEAPWLLVGAKTLSYGPKLEAERFAHAHGADDAIFLSTDGFVLEAPRANVVIARDHTLLTPAPQLGLL